MTQRPGDGCADACPSPGRCADYLVLYSLNGTEIWYQIQFENSVVTICLKHW